MIGAPLCKPDILLVKLLQVPYIAQAPAFPFPFFVSEYDMTEYNASVICSELEMAHYFEAMLEEGISAKNAATWLTL